MSARDLERQGCRTDSGFTLVEILVVLLIIGIISGVLINRISKSGQRARYELSAEGFIRTVGAAMERYKGDRRIGVYPPGKLDGFDGLGRQTNRTNRGIEALVICLNGSGFRGERVLEDFEGGSGDITMDNIDADLSAKKMTIMGAKDLFEMLDPWGNPYAYFHCTDYNDKTVREYMSDSEVAMNYELVTVLPWKNPKTKSFYKQTSYQLFSAGPDGVFNTEDDIGNW